MSTDKELSPEIKLLHSIIEDETKAEEDKKLLEPIKRKAVMLYSLLSLTGNRDFDEDELRKQIKSLIEEDI